MPDTLSPSNQPFSDPLLARFFLSPEEKKSKEKGKQIVKAFYATQITGDNTGFFKQRNLRWIELLLWCKGSQPMQEFLDYMNVADANKAYVQIDTTQSRLAAQFVGTLVESMAKNKTYPCVTAIDDGSMNEKEERMFDALFRMHEVQTINELQQESGLVLEPPNAYVPDDEMSARVYFELEDRLPKEIRFEKYLAKIQNDIKFHRVANRKTLFDGVVLNAGFTKIERLAASQYTVRKCIPTNMVYNFFMNDTGEYEVTQIGEFYNLKVKDMRSKFGKSESRPNGLSEQEIFNLAKLSTQQAKGNFSFTWNNDWSSPNQNQNRPYDDFSVFVLDCEINCGEDVYYVEKLDAFGKPNITKKKTIPYQQRTKDGNFIEQVKPEGVEVIKRQKNSWMRGIYAPYGDVMLYWGEPDIIITPYTNVAKPLSSYSVNIPNNDGEYVPSLFERILEPLREYQLTKLKRKQLIAKIKPSGIRIDVESARNLDLGNGDSIAWQEVVRIYDQTGNELWSSKGADPLQREAPPLSNTVQDESIQKVIGLTSVLAGIVMEIRQLIGVPMYRDGSDVGDRTSGVLQQQQNSASYNVTDYILNGNNQLWEETFYKLCLLKWNDVVKEEPESSNDMLNTRFDVAVKTKSTDYEREMLEKDIERYSQVLDGSGNPVLSPKDALMLRQIDDYKLACWYLATTVESNRRKSMEDSLKLQEQNQKIQAETAKQAQEQALALQDAELAHKKELSGFEALNEMKLEVLRGALQIAAKSENPEMPNWLAPIITQIVPNIVIPTAAQNKEVVQGIQQQEQEEQMQQQEMAQQEMMQQDLPPQQEIQSV